MKQFTIILSSILFFHLCLTAMTIEDAVKDIIAWFTTESDYQSSDDTWESYKNS